MPHNLNRSLLLILCVIALNPVLGQQKPPAGPLIFQKQQVASESFESVNVMDINKDGSPDIFSGSFWYNGPNYLNRNFTGPVKRYGEYYDDFSTIVLDVNNDGNPDIITGGWFGGELVWKENPGKKGNWPEHLIARTGNIESTRAWDIDGDGTIEIVPNTPGKPLVIYRLKKQSLTFDSVFVREKHGHGLGYGDINGDGRGDLIVDKGWLECPAEPFSQSWVFHPELDLVQASVPMLVSDVDGDGDNDLIIGQGHDYGLSWYEQRLDKKKVRTWVKHPIDPYNSQFHTMALADLDNDGSDELITGKRYRAHDDNDPGAHDPVGLYYFKWNGQFFSKQVISYGSPGEGKGTGIYFAVEDLNKDNWKDIVVAGKDGLWVLYNKGPAK